jgi:hypothetical protein
LPERNWHEDNWELNREIGNMKTVQATQGRDIAHHDEKINSLNNNQEKIFGKLDKMNWQLGLIVGIGIAVQVLLNYFLPGK